MFIITKYPEKYKDLGVEVFDDKVYNTHQEWLINKFGYGYDSRDLDFKGKDCLIIGMGPSRKTLDFGKLKNDVVTIAINKAGVEFPESDFWFAHDTETLGNWGKDVPISMPMITYGYNVYRDNWDKRGERQIYFYEICDDPRRDKRNKLYWNETSLGLAISLAINLGSKRVFLVGHDLGGGYYDHPQYDNKMQDVQMKAVRERMLNMFTSEERVKWEKGFSEIYDLSNGPLPIKKGSLSDLYV